MGLSRQRVQDEFQKEVLEILKNIYYLKRLLRRKPNIICSIKQSSQRRFC